MIAFRLTPLAVFVVTSVAAAQPQQWKLDAKPSLTLGADAGESSVLFTIVVGATRLPDGGILVGDRGEFALRIFAPDGKLRTSVGRKGSGPGEIRYLATVSRCGDLVFTYDIEEGYRMTVFDLSGKYVRDFRWTAPGDQRVPYRSACNRAGTFVHIGWEKLLDAKAGGTLRLPVPRWTSAGSAGTPKLIDSVPGSERWVQVEDGKLRGSRPLPLGKQPVVGIGRTQMYYGSGDQFEIRAATLDGRPTATLRRAEAAAPVTQADIRDVIDREVADKSFEGVRARVQAAYAKMTMPKTLPAYTHLLVDASDMVWVRHFPRGTAIAAKWSVFEPGGKLAAEVDVPRHLEVYEIGADYLLGRYMDPDEAVPQVRMYKLTRNR